MRRSDGFTIIELLIATAVFSLILIGITTSVMRFSHQYYKGLVSNSTQATARAIIDDVVRAIQFNGGTVSDISDGSGNLGYCVGTNKRYNFVIGRQVVDASPVGAEHQGYHGLVSDTVTACNSTTDPLDVKNMSAIPASTVNARELLGEHMRLTKFSIVPNASGDMFAVTVRVVYGDDDLMTNAADPDMNCRGDVGSQFCATSELSTTINKRVN